MFIVSGLASLSLSCGAQTTAENHPVVRPISEGVSPYVVIADPVVLLDNVTLHRGNGEEALTDSAVLIAGDKIMFAGKRGSFKIPKSARVIDLSGHTVMPGIVGLHNHTHMPGVHLMAYTAPRMYLAGGVTTIQTTGSADTLGELKLARDIQAQKVPGPKVFPTAPYITGPGGNAVMDKPETEAAAREFVQKWSNQGVTWFKLYRHTDPAIAAIMIDEAHKLGRKVTGHLCSITFAEAAAMGIDSIEHGLNAATDFVLDKPKGECVPSRASKLDLSLIDERTADLISTLVASDVTLTSTLAILETGYPSKPQADARALLAMSPDLQKRYHARQEQLRERAETTTSTPDYWQLLTNFERQFVKAGGHLVAGPDTGRHVFPGYGDQRNFELLAEAGFSIPETVKIMTHNGAQTLGIGDDTGLVQKGFRADLIVLAGDLSADTAVIRNTKYVFKDGLGYDPQILLSDIVGQVGVR